MLSDVRRTAAIQAIHEFGYFKKVEWFSEIDSTNRYLARECKSGQIPLPALIVTDRQSRGVGRGGNTWWSPEGCLMFSIAMPWSQRDKESAKLPLLAGMAVAQTVTQLVHGRACVKWPNDVYLEDRKICGILMESSAKTDETSHDICIIGIGINCCVDFSNAPDELRSTAISLHESYGSRIEEAITPESVLLQFLHRWVAVHEEWRNDPQWIESNWESWDWLSGRMVEVTLPSRVIQGIASGIDSTGALIIIDRFGRNERVISGTVRPIVTY